MRVRRFFTLVVLGLMMIAIGISVSWPARDFLTFLAWCYSNKVPCALFDLNYHILGLNLSTMSQSTAQVLFNLGVGIALLGFAMIFLTVGNTRCISKRVT